MTSSPSGVKAASATGGGAAAKPELASPCGGSGSIAGTSQQPRQQQQPTPPQLMVPRPFLRRGSHSADDLSELHRSAKPYGSPSVPAGRAFEPAAGTNTGYGLEFSASGLTDSGSTGVHRCSQSSSTVLPPSAARPSSSLSLSFPVPSIVTPVKTAAPPPADEAAPAAASAANSVAAAGGAAERRGSRTSSLDSSTAERRKVHFAIPSAISTTSLAAADAAAALTPPGCSPAVSTTSPGTILLPAAAGVSPCLPVLGAAARRRSVCGTSPVPPIVVPTAPSDRSFDVCAAAAGGGPTERESWAGTPPLTPPRSCSSPVMSVAGSEHAAAPCARSFDSALPACVPNACSLTSYPGSSVESAALHLPMSPGLGVRVTREGGRSVVHISPVSKPVALGSASSFSGDASSNFSSASGSQSFMAQRQVRPVASPCGPAAGHHAADYQPQMHPLRPALRHSSRYDRDGSSDSNSPLSCEGGTRRSRRAALASTVGGLFRRRGRQPRSTASPTTSPATRARSSTENRMKSVALVRVFVFALIGIGTVLLISI